jgi:hypothetical protein
VARNPWDLCVTMTRQDKTRPLRPGVDFECTLLWKHKGAPGTVLCVANGKKRTKFMAPLVLTATVLLGQCCSARCLCPIYCCRYCSSSSIEITRRTSLARCSPNGKLARSSRPRRRARADRNQRWAAPPKRGNRRFESSPALYGSGVKHRRGAGSRLVVRLLDEEAAQHSVLRASRTQQRR